MASIDKVAIAIAGKNIKPAKKGNTFKKNPAKIVVRMPIIVVNVESIQMTHHLGLSRGINWRLITVFFINIPDTLDQNHEPMKLIKS